MRICILTPGALGSDPRVVKEADSLHRAGHDVVVISTRTLQEVDGRDTDVLDHASWSSTRLDYRRRGAAWYARRAAQAASQAAFDATGRLGFAEAGFSVFARPLLAAAKSVRAEMYIAHYPAALPAAAKAARAHGAIYAFDAEDFHLGDWPDEPAYEAKRSMLRRIESRFLPGCAYVTAASPGIADAYAAAYGIPRPAVVLNTFPRVEALRGPSAAGTIRPSPSLYWFSQTIGPDRGLECAARAIGLARSKPHLYLRGGVSPAFAARLSIIANEVDATASLHIMPPELPSEMERLAASYDAGLSGEPGHSANNRLALGNKIFTYLAAGIPAVLSDVPAHCDFASVAGPAVRLFARNDANSLASVLDDLFEDHAGLARARETAFRLGCERFNWSIEEKKLLAEIDRAGHRNKLNGSGKAYLT